jgi:uncharacterized protein YprB with RNaseH-like and TPR domain
VLQHTFCHLPRIGTATEARLWDHGVTSWEHACSPPGVAHLPTRQRDRLLEGVRASREHLAAGQASHFAGALPPALHWRFFPEFRDRVAYLDIETTGLGGPGDHITTVALYDGREVRHYVHGVNLDELEADLRQHRMLVTYNGKCFDLPFIERCLGIRLSVAHLDLRYLLASLGYRGGLKGVERALGLQRGEVEGLQGAHAVVLWHLWAHQGRQEALETLLAYNIQDTVVLEQLMVLAYNLQLRLTPFAGELLPPPPAPPPSPFAADPATVAEVLDTTW